MALHRTKSELPADAVKITEAEAVKYQWDLIKLWEPQKDVWPFNYGTGLLGISSALSSIFIHRHYRSKLKLGELAAFSTYLPNVIIPSCIGPFFHAEFITRDILIAKTPCPVCVELRSAAFQILVSTVYPVITSPLSCFVFASRYYTFNIPSFQQPREVLKLFMKMTRPIGNILFSISVLQAFLAMGVTYYEVQSLATIQSKLLKLEEYYSSQHE